jgi:hypothetical protein
MVAKWRILHNEVQPSVFAIFFGIYYLKEDGQTIICQSYHLPVSISYNVFMHSLEHMVEGACRANDEAVIAAQEKKLTFVINNTKSEAILNEAEKLRTSLHDGLYKVDPHDPPWRYTLSTSMAISSSGKFTFKTRPMSFKNERDFEKFKAVSSKRKSQFPVFYQVFCRWSTFSRIFS